MWHDEGPDAVTSTEYAVWSAEHGTARDMCVVPGGFRLCVFGFVQCCGTEVAYNMQYVGGKTERRMLRE